MLGSRHGVCKPVSSLLLSFVRKGEVRPNSQSSLLVNSDIVMDVVHTLERTARKKSGNECWLAGNWSELRERSIRLPFLVAANIEAYCTLRGLRRRKWSRGT